MILLRDQIYARGYCIHLSLKHKTSENFPNQSFSFHTVRIVLFDCYCLSVSGEDYFLYNSEEDKVYDGGTGKISEKFGPKKGQDIGVPDNLDTAYFDKRDKNIYFFKGDTVSQKYIITIYIPH